MFIHRFEVALKQTEDLLLIPSQLPKRIPSGITVPKASSGGNNIANASNILFTDIVKFISTYGCI